MGGPPARRAATEAQRAYLLDHRIPELVNACVRELVRARPVDPATYLLQLLQCPRNPLELRPA
eukprot:NODE_5375_length_513_cov_17.575431_g3994_i0.p2 GENE.NODE_5375_length_513_cov_17.575431_g3994_i0~~NODE_5375_length_513_cov_17.575431_g3994_i0.p2  ORF type:complete len:73 (-),score=26.45 NODE_5375_length_513_cov_17.575431_g3994_i0:295-483(-)